MNIFVLRNNDHTIRRVFVHPTLMKLDGWVKIQDQLIDETTSKITADPLDVEFEDIVKHPSKFKVSDTGVITLNAGVTSLNLSSRKIDKLDDTTPLSFTRANTIVNLGRL